MAKVFKASICDEVSEPIPVLDAARALTCAELKPVMAVVLKPAKLTEVNALI
jgi:hypothetical protein